MIEMDITKWARDNIIWSGNKNTNKSDRRGRTPLAIVNHIVEGTAQSCISWFTSPNNNGSSTHFLVGKDGRVYQFVAIEDNAWGNGIALSAIPQATSNLVKSRPNDNPNWYSVSIEHEGRHAETQGELTSKQLASTIMLHSYIINYVKEKYKTTIPANRAHIIGHNEISPREKPNCPGNLFPFDAIIRGLTGSPVNETPFNDIQGNWAEESIKKAFGYGLMRGTSGNTFSPNTNVTRAQLSVALVRLYEKLKK